MWHFCGNAHWQREPVSLHEESDQTWAAKMITFLIEVKKLRAREVARDTENRDLIGDATRNRIR